MESFIFKNISSSLFLKATMLCSCFGSVAVAATGQPSAVSLELTDVRKLKRVETTRNVFGAVSNAPSAETRVPKVDMSLYVPLTRKIKDFKDQEVGSIISEAEKSEFNNIFTYENMSNIHDAGVKQMRFFRDLPQALTDVKHPNLRGGRDKTPPNKEQFNAIKQVVLSESAITIVEGVPGAGKTSGVLKWVLGFIKREKPMRPVYLSAPNIGGMSAVGGDFGGENAAGTAKILTFNELVQNNALEDGAFVIIDECYAMSKEHLSRLLDVAKAKNWRILLTGDSKQNMPKDNIYGMLSVFPTCHLNLSFRAGRVEERDFVRIFAESPKDEALQNALLYLSDHKPDVIGKIGDMKKYLISLNNIFANFSQDDGKINTHISAAAKWAKYYKDKNQVDNTMIVLEESDYSAMHRRLSAEGFSYEEISKIVKTSLESQGASVSHVAVILNKKMTESNIYVALSRQKEDATVFVPIGESEPYFSSPEAAIKHRYRSDQRAAEAEIEGMEARRGAARGKFRKFVLLNQAARAFAAGKGGSHSASSDDENVNESRYASSDDENSNRSRSSSSSGETFNGSSSASSASSDLTDSSY